MKTNVEWREWGRQDPLYGVATWAGKAREGDEPWTDEEFYEVGAQDWADFAAHWRAYGMPRGSCLEIGCGAGRVTRELARDFDHVIAVDVSADMVEYAKLHVPGNVEFAVTDGTSLPAPRQSVDGVFSVLVLQHLERVDDVERYLREVWRVLRPGGTMMIQVPIYAWPGSFVGFKILYGIRRAAATVRAAIRRRLLEAGRGRPFFRYLRVDLDRLEPFLHATGFTRVELHTFKPAAHPEWLTFIMAAKPVDAVAQHALPGQMDLRPVPSLDLAAADHVDPAQCEREVDDRE